jgi:hypothetical protein
MGIHSEIIAEREARSLEGVLKAALETRDAAVISFCTTHVVPLFDDAVLEAFGSFKGDKTVRDAFDGNLSSLQTPNRKVERHITNKSSGQ